MEGKDKRMKDGMTGKRMSMKHCGYCGQSFEQYDDGKGTPQLYCSKVCRNSAHKQRNLESRARELRRWCMKYLPGLMAKVNEQEDVHRNGSNNE
jgi:hypothetical protein